MDDYVALFYGGSSALEAAATVPSGATDADMALSPSATISGRITAADSGAPLEHAQVTVYNLSNRVVATQLTAFDGSFSIRGSLPSGPYRIRVAPGTWSDGTPRFSGYEPIFSGGARTLAEAQPLTIVAPATVAVALAMPKTPAPPPPTPTPTPPGAQRLYLPLLRR